MRRGTDVVCAGILVADHVCTPMARLPDAGHLVAVDAMYLRTGGCAANVAVNIARQEIGVKAVGKIGNDYWGQFVRDDLTQQGVDMSSVLVSDSAQTSQTMILLCRGEDRRFVHTFGANGEFTVSDIRKEDLADAKVFYVGGYLVLPGFNPVELASLFSYCREQGIQTVLDVVIPTGFVYDNELEDILPHTDVFLPNNDEGEMLTGEYDPVRQVRALRERGVTTVVVTMGGEGLLYSQGEAIWRARHFRSKVVDQTGAGDAFCAGFISGMVRGEDLQGCIHYGSALGASCVRSIGCYQGVFTASEARTFLEDNRLVITQIC
jgi:sugar/nucleoside kinase (ribokinase family)